MSIADRVARRFLKAGRVIPMSNGAGTTEEYGRVWPEVRGWDLDDIHSDPAGVNEVWYALDEPGAHLEVVFRNQYWHTSSLDRYRNDTGQKWSGPEDIPKILAKVLKEVKAEEASQLKAIKGLAGPKWSVDDDYLGLLEYSFSDGEASITVMFKGADDMLKDGRPQTAEISFSAGSDYEGSFGNKEKSVRYKSIEDMAKILKDAERWYRSLTTQQ